MLSGRQVLLGRREQARLSEGRGRGKLAYMDNLARIRNTLHGIPILQRQAIVPAHVLEDVGLPSVDAVLDLAESCSPEGCQQPLVDCRSRFDPLIVGAREAIWGIDPCPHDQGTRTCKNGRVREG
jgi:hypothetical protein